MIKRKIVNANYIKMAIILIVVFLVSSCKKNYPITAYDHDLKNEKRISIIKSYNTSLELQEKLKNKSKDNIQIDDIVVENTLLNPVDETIESDFVSFEDEDDKNSVESIDSEFPVVILFKNQPDFDLKDYTANTFENYHELDSLGRVGQAFAMLGKETMPTGSRESIGMIKPSGWHTVKYDNINGNYLYNRCHLIGWQLSAENANVKNLFTGTRYLNVQGMLPFENKVAEYIKNTGNHVLYRVTPYFSGKNLVASHIQIEAMSYEDNGEGICFNVKLDNIQPGIYINYADGTSKKEIENEDVNT